MRNGRPDGKWSVLGLGVSGLSALLLASPGCAPENETSPRVGEGRCTPGAATTGAPQSIAEAVALINGLPRPTTVACLIESLDRPLRLTATKGIISAQPAASARSPRMFLRSGALTLSVVPEGEGAKVVEFAEARPNHFSVKAELVFPVTGNVSPEAPYERVLMSPDRTSCSLCHANEQPEGRVGSVQIFSSRALRPVRAERVPLRSLWEESSACDEPAEPERCALFSALFSDDSVEEYSFPEEMGTIVPE